MSCYCKIGLHIECENPTRHEDGTFACCCMIEDVEPTQRERAQKNDEDVSDVLSTGRKRAALEYPITEGMVCEWAGLLYAGGGIIPIIGCPGNTLGKDRGAYARHHGPDKNTLNNAPGNVHRICPFCHNRWHTLNDQFYGKRPEDGVPFIPLVGDGSFPLHDSDTLATPEQIAAHEAWWATPEKTRPAYRSA